MLHGENPVVAYTFCFDQGVELDKGNRNKSPDSMHTAGNPRSNESECASKQALRVFYSMLPQKLCLMDLHFSAPKSPVTIIDIRRNEEHNAKAYNMINSQRRSVLDKA